ncbi:hypothetical protein ACFUV2_24735 [Streptomyces pilosus]|uniref:hypothetical protein n=1 Tax=Streptomyces pilosus TaxID=28893 RepID=UPI00362BE29E
MSASLRRESRAVPGAVASSTPGEEDADLMERSVGSEGPYLSDAWLSGEERHL